MPLTFRHIKNRKDFFRVLDEAISESEKKVKLDPEWGLCASFLKQFLFMRTTTENGRKPTFDERKSITIDLAVSRELESVSDLEWYDYGDKATQLAQYYQFWRSDRGMKTLDTEDWKSDFPQEYDLSDEPDTE